MIDRPAVIPHLSDRPGERGTAFVVALLVLTVLTVAGLALTLMTQTEVRIGANEREANRTFYASDSGIHVSTARTLWVTNDKILTIQLNTSQQDSGSSTAPPVTFADQIQVTPLYAVYPGAISLGQINQNQPTPYAAITHVVNSTSSRLGNPGTSYSQGMAQKLVGSMIELQPWPKEKAIVYHPNTIVTFKH